MIRFNYFIRFIRFIYIKSIFSVGLLLGEDTTSEIILSDGSKITLATYSIIGNFVESDGLNEFPLVNLNEENLLELKFAKKQPKDILLSFRSLIDDLKNPNFKIREKASSKLSLLGNGFQQIIKTFIKHSLDPEIRWRLREILISLPSQNEHSLDRILTAEGIKTGYVTNFILRSNYLDKTITLSREQIDSINFNPVRKNIESSEFEYNKLINNLPLYDVKIDFENSFNDKTLTEGRSINNAFEDLGVILNAEPSFLTISSVLIPEVSGKYSATNSNPLYEGTINGRFIDSKSKRKLGVNKLAFSLGLIKPNSINITLHDFDNNELASYINSKKGPSVVSFRSKQPISYFRITPIEKTSPSVAITDFWFSKPKEEHITPNNKHKLITLANGDKIHCKSIKISNEILERKKQTKLVPYTGFSDTFNINNSKINSIVLSNNENKISKNNGTYIWCLLSNGSKLKLNISKEKKPENELTNTKVDLLPVAAIWPSEMELYVPPSINFKNNDIALYIRKDPVFLSRFSFENTYFIGTKDNESRIKYNYSRVPTVWIKNPPSNNQSIMTIELMDGQIFSLSRDGVYQFLSIDENQITFKFNELKKAVPLKLIKKIKF